MEARHLLALDLRDPSRGTGVSTAPPEVTEVQRVTEAAEVEATLSRQSQAQRRSS